MNDAPSLAAHEFRKATRSYPDKACVEVARRGEVVEVRDSKTEFGSTADHRITLTDREFDAFLAGVRDGNTSGTALEVLANENTTYVLRTTTTPDVELHFTEAEILAFYDGIHHHEFDAPAFAH